MLGGIASRSQITDFEYRLILVYLYDIRVSDYGYRAGNAKTYTYENVVWFEIRVYDIALFHERQCQKDLMRVGPYGSQIQSNIFTESLDDISQVHAAETNSSIG